MHEKEKRKKICVKLYTAGWSFSHQIKWCFFFSSEANFRDDKEKSLEKMTHNFNMQNEYVWIFEAHQKIIQCSLQWVVFYLSNATIDRRISIWGAKKKMSEILSMRKKKNYQKNLSTKKTKTKKCNAKKVKEWLRIW